MALVQWGYYNLTGPRFGLFNQFMKYALGRRTSTRHAHGADTDLGRSIPFFLSAWPPWRSVNQSATFPNATELFFTGQSLFARLNGSFPIGIQAARKLLFTPGTGVFANPPAFSQLNALCSANQAGPVFQTWGISLQQCAYVPAALPWRVPSQALR